MSASNTISLTSAIGLVFNELNIIHLTEVETYLKLTFRKITLNFKKISE